MQKKSHIWQRALPFSRFSSDFTRTPYHITSASAPAQPQKSDKETHWQYLFFPLCSSAAAVGFVLLSRTRNNAKKSIMRKHRFLERTAHTRPCRATAFRCSRIIREMFFPYRRGYTKTYGGGCRVSPR